MVLKTIGVLGLFTIVCTVMQRARQCYEQAHLLGGNSNGLLFLMSVKTGHQTDKQMPDFVGGYKTDSVLLLGRISNVYCYLMNGAEVKVTKAPLYPIKSELKINIEFTTAKAKEKPKPTEKVTGNDWQEGYEADEMKYFIKFSQEISKSPYQLVRKSAKPLFVSNKASLNCSGCKAQMDFQFQFMPYLLDLVVYSGLNVQQMLEAVEFGTVLIYKCSCDTYAGIIQHG